MYICYVYIWIQLVTIEKEFICYSAVVILLYDWRYFLGYFIKFIWIIVLVFQVPQVCFGSRFSLIIRVPGLRSDPWIGSRVSGFTFKIPCFGSPLRRVQVLRSRVTPNVPGLVSDFSDMPMKNCLRSFAKNYLLINFSVFIVLANLIFLIYCYFFRIEAATSVVL